MGILSVVENYKANQNKADSAMIRVNGANELEQYNQLFGGNAIWSASPGETSKYYMLGDLLPVGFQAIFSDSTKTKWVIVNSQGQRVTNPFVIEKGRIVFDTDSQKSTSAQTQSFVSSGIQLKESLDSSKITSKQILQYGGILIAAIVLFKLLFGKRKVVTV